MKAHYIRKQYQCGDHIHVCEGVTYMGRRGKREPKSQPTRAEIQRYNNAMRRRQIERKAHANFGLGDMHIIMTYRKDERPTPEVAAQQLEKFQDKARKLYRSHGMKYKYMATTDIGKKGAIHHHLLVNHIDPYLLQKLWPYGKIIIEFLYSMAFQHLARYFWYNGEHMDEICGRSGKHRVTCSHGLIDPAPEREEIAEREIREDVEPPDGYELVPDSDVRDVNPTTAAWWRYYILRKKQPRKPPPLLPRNPALQLTAKKKRQKRRPPPCGNDPATGTVYHTGGR